MSARLDRTDGTNVDFGSRWQQEQQRAFADRLDQVAAELRAIAELSPESDQGFFGKEHLWK